MVVTFSSSLLRYRTFSNACSSGVVYLVTLLRSKDCTFSSLRIMKHTITPYNVYNVLWDVGAVSDS